jgi:hypothetical protein
MVHHSKLFESQFRNLLLSTPNTSLLSFALTDVYYIPYVSPHILRTQEQFHVYDMFFHSFLCCRAVSVFFLTHTRSNMMVIATWKLSHTHHVLD